MTTYLLRRLFLIPVTLFCIIMVNFIIINLAPGDPSSFTEISAESGAVKKEGSAVSGGDMRYLQFREHYGLTLPLIFNNWPSMSLDEVLHRLKVLSDPAHGGLPLKEYEAMRVTFGDQSRFVMDKLLEVIKDNQLALPLRIAASTFFVRGGTRQAYVNASPNEVQKNYNRKVAEDNLFLSMQKLEKTDPPITLKEKIHALSQWYDKNKEIYVFEPEGWEKLNIFFFETRFCRYFGRVLTLDFGTIRNDPNKTVISEVVKRLKYSLTLSVIPMILTFFFCQLFGFVMAYYQGKSVDQGLNLLFLLLYAIPIYVAAPFLIEKVALGHYFFFTSTPIPLSGFHSPEKVYLELTSAEKLRDIVAHLALPLASIMYGGLAAQTRICRTAVSEVMKLDYVRTARAKGLSVVETMVKHVGRNASITIVTSVASSLGVVLGGSLIVETLFEIPGFGKFFYEGVINRDYNVIMFSSLAGSFLALMGYVVADIMYMFLDPRVTLDK